MRKILRDTSGQAAILVGLMLPVIVGCAALAIDLAFFHFRQDQLQAAADAGALAAALDLSDLEAAKAAAIAIATKNMPEGSGDITTTEDVVFGVYDADTKTFTPGAENVNAAKVTTHRSAARDNAEPTFFAGIWGVADVDIGATATAVSLGPGTCFYVLQPTGRDALLVTGNGQVSVPNCGVQVNSSDSQALKISGGGSMNTHATCVVGGVSGSGFTPEPETGCPALADPLASLPEPSKPTPTCYNTTDLNISGTYTAVPNQTYCHKINISNSANVTFPPGLYYFEKADIKITNSASISGSGVTFFLDKDSKLDIASSGTVNLTAPTSGTYKGILIFHSRSASGPQAHDKITGSPTLQLGGTLYMPSVFLEMAGSGDVSITAKAGYVIAKKYKYTGDVDFRFDSRGTPVPSALGQSSTLIE